MVDEQTANTLRLALLSVFVIGIAFPFLASVFDSDPAIKYEPAINPVTHFQETDASGALLYQPRTWLGQTTFILQKYWYLPVSLLIVGLFLYYNGKAFNAKKKTLMHFEDVLDKDLWKDGTLEDRYKLSDLTNFYAFVGFISNVVLDPQGAQHALYVKRVRHLPTDLFPTIHVISYFPFEETELGGSKVLASAGEKIVLDYMRASDLGQAGWRMVGSGNQPLENVLAQEVSSGRLDATEVAPYLPQKQEKGLIK